MKNARHAARREMDRKTRLAVSMLAALLVVVAGVTLWYIHEARVTNGGPHTAGGAPGVSAYAHATPLPIAGSASDIQATPSAASVLPTSTPGSPKITKPDNAVVIFTFDDGDASDYLLAYPILKQYGIRGTSYLITKFIDEGAEGKMTWDEVKEMAAYGWVFGGHTYDHRHMTKMTDEEIRQSMEDVNISFERQGFPAPEIMAYPYGGFNQRVVDDVKPFCKQARLAFYRDDFVDLGHVDPYRIPCVSADMQSQALLEKLEKLVDKACAEKAVVVFRVHCLYREKPYDTVKVNHTILSGSGDQTSSVLFGDLVKYCVDKECAFMTMTELMDLYS